MEFFKQRMWLVFAVFAAILWGLWGVVSKINSESSSPFMNHILFTLGMVITVPFVIKNTKKVAFNTKGFLWGMVSGVFAVAGNLAIYFAFEQGAKAAVAIPVTGLYPLVTIILALFMFNEKVNWVQLVGVIIAIPAIMMLSGETAIFSDTTFFLKNINYSGWFVRCLVALCCWGIFSALQKQASNFIPANWCYISFITASLVVSVFFIGNNFLDNSLTNKALALGILAGVLNGLGVLFSFSAYRANGKAGTVTVIIGVLQPIFTILPAVLILNEKLNTFMVTGIILAIVGSVFLSYEKKK
jgi:drug/metabolite transporter (DMT)-like permease